MSYNIQHLSTAGRATVLTILLGVLCFAFIFIFNIGSNEFRQAVAQSDNATTSVTVINLPPVITGQVQETFESSTAFPTNSGDVVQWEVLAVDASGDDYYLLICDTNATPTPSGGGVPSCASGVQWAVSSLTTSNATATAATTTLETAASLFDESNVWFGFVCDDNVVTQRCTGTTPAQQGYGTVTSPFNVNNRPVFTLFSNNGPVDPDGTITFYSTSTDPDTDGGQDQVQLIVCSNSGYNTTTNSCTGSTLATSSLMYPDAFAAWTLTPPWQDTTYNSVPFVIDEHGHEASGGVHAATTTFDINNVAPTVDGSTISLNSGSDMILTVEASTTQGFTLDFNVFDNNSCQAIGSTSEVTNYELSIYRDDGADNYPADGNLGSTTCRVNIAGDHDENDCYTSAVATTTWNLSCTASTTACSGSTDTSDAFSCTFPLWFIADPTDATTTAVQYPLNDWKTQVRAVDDDSATGTASESTSGVDVNSFLAFDLLSFLIPYGSLAPGEDSDDVYANLGASQASTTIHATGNVGVDELLSGESMCTTYTGPGTECANSATSTVQDFRQVFSPTSTATYANASTSGNNLSSTSAQELEINVGKSTSTSTPASGITYWGIEIPGTITLSGDYTGQNTFIAVVGESTDW